ncbi:hypothetical protein LCGC14_2063010 [marine sediment metagenome]|uniref:Uncharacterized protein n=1 Tax=marine sediment metagenome TaxID=412755 RepID=A0A0F9EKR6_9ZZZZ
MEFHMRRKPTRTKSKTLMVCGVWLPPIVYRGRKSWAVLAKSWAQTTCKNCLRIHESKRSKS